MRGKGNTLRPDDPLAPDGQQPSGASPNRERILGWGTSRVSEPKGRQFSEARLGAVV